MVVREANWKKRVKWCKERRGRTVDNYQKKVISDESQIVLGLHLAKGDEKCNLQQISPCSERKIILLIWGCICYVGAGTLTSAKGNINSAKYIMTRPYGQ